MGLARIYLVNRVCYVEVFEAGRSSLSVW
jgi:hypothetical protein